MNHTVSSLLHNCQSLKSLKTIHGRLVVEGPTSFSDLIINKILRLYFRFGAADVARKTFDGITQPNPFLWTSMIHGYVENFQYAEAFTLFITVQKQSLPLLNYTLSSVIKALGRLKRVKDGEAICGLVLKLGFSCDLTVRNALIDLFMRCGNVDFAKWVFDDMSEKDIVSWNSMISGYSNVGRFDVARELFDSMPHRNVISWTSIICAYTKTGDMEEARGLFEAMPTRDLAAWKVMISGYMDVGNVDAARCLFEAMPNRDVGTWNLMISGFCKAGALETAKVYFDMMPAKNAASWNMMIDGCIEAGNLDEARFLFDQMPEKNLVSWSTLIWGYAKNGQPHAALDLFECFKKLGIKPDEAFILSIISACSQLGIVDAVESIIWNLADRSIFSNLSVITSLIDMYAKCGNIEKALQVFEMAYQKDLLCYSSMIIALANHGLAQDAISLFNDMQREKIKPDGVTFLGVLTACNHGGLVNEGRRFFNQMTGEFGIQAHERHYACMVDILGRAGCLEEAHNLINSMPMTPTSVVWGALLAACTVHCNVKLAEIAAAELFRIEQDNSGNYILLSNIYAAAGQWLDVIRVRALIRKQRVKKNRASSWIELDSEVHEFVMGDASHLDKDRIYFILDLLSEEMRPSELPISC